MTTYPMTAVAGRWKAHPQHFWLHGRKPEQLVRFDEEMGRWDVYGHPEALTILNDPVTFSSDTKRLYSSESVNAHKEGNLIQLDEPEHRKLRTLVSHAFTPKVVADLEPRITSLTHELLDGFADRGEVELMTDLAYPLPVIVIAELLGVPSSDRHLFKKWVSVMFENTAQISLAESDEEVEREGGDLLAQWQPIFDYIREHVAERRRRPKEDLLTRLVSAEVDGNRLTDTEVVTFAVLLLVGGHVTTTMMLGSAMLCLDAHPDWAGRVRADRSLVPGTLEESIRLFSPFPSVARSTTNEADVAGRRVPRDQMVMVWTAAANRDPRQFGEPDAFDPTRDPNPHLAFGRGIHFCLGAPLARLEGRVALNMLLDRFSSLRIDPDKSPEFIPSLDLTGLSSLPMRIG